MNVKIVECEVERLLAVIGGKWKVLILRELFSGARRHAELRKALPGISQKVLTAQLRELELLVSCWCRLRARSSESESR